MDKLNRNYLLSVEAIDSGTLIIQPPFTLEFDITRNVLSSANTSSIRIFNLSETNRNKIRKNRWDYGDIRLIQLKAGYGTNIPVVFEGYVSQCWSVREGTNFITEVQSFDAGFAWANAKTNQQFPAGTTQSTILETLLRSLPGVSIGAIGDFTGALTRGNSFSGSTTDILREISGGAFFIDNGKGYCLKDGECIPGEIDAINSASGLLGTPVLEQTYLNFDIIFEPRLVIGQRLFLQSLTAKNFDGFYKVVSLKHKGMISESVCGNAITSVGLFAPPEITMV